MDERNIVVTDPNAAGFTDPNSNQDEEDGMDASVASRLSFHYNEEEGNEFKISSTKLVAGALAVVVALGLGLGVGVAINKSKKPTPTPAPTTLAPTTAAPTLEPISQEVLLLESVLPDYSLASIKSDRNSPQGRAYDWLLEDLLDGTTLDANAHQDRILQRYSLATFYYSTKGDEWFENKGWMNHSLHECLWYNKPWFSRVPYEGFDARFWANDNYNPCEWPTMDPTMTSGGHQTILHFWLYENGLQGTIPAEFGLLTGLVSMYLYNNFYGGQIPSEVGNMKHLAVFNMGANKLTGTLPTELGGLYSLRGLSIFVTDIGGPIPSQLGLLSKLSTLKLDEQSLTGTIPTVLEELQRVHELWLSRNLLTGSIPTELGRYKPLDFRGSDFIIFGNLLTGQIPSQLGLVTGRLDLFWVNDMLLTGTIPSQLGQMVGTKDFKLGNNQLTGTLPSDLGLCTSAFRIDVHGNQLTGTIPSELGVLPSLFFYIFNDNSFSGPIPSELPNSNLETPIWINNAWNGLHWVSELGVEYLPDPPLVFAVQNNNLSGTIPETFGLVDYVAMALTNNALLTGTVPDGLCSTPIWPSFSTEMDFFDCTNLLCGCNCTCSGNGFSSEATSSGNSSHMTRW